MAWASAEHDLEATTSYLVQSRSEWDSDENFGYAMLTRRDDVVGACTLVTRRGPDVCERLLGSQRLRSQGLRHGRRVGPGRSWSGPARDRSCRDPPRRRQPGHPDGTRRRRALTRSVPSRQARWRPATPVLTSCECVAVHIGRNQPSYCGHAAWRRNTCAPKGPLVKRCCRGSEPEPQFEAGRRRAGCCGSGPRDRRDCSPAPGRSSDPLSHTVGQRRKGCGCGSRGLLW
jgi:hypothetical protein